MHPLFLEFTASFKNMFEANNLLKSCWNHIWIFWQNITHVPAVIYSAVVFISLQPNSKCQTLVMSCRVQALSVYKHMRRLFRRHSGLANKKTCCYVNFHWDDWPLASIFLKSKLGSYSKWHFSQKFSIPFISRANTGPCGSRVFLMTIFHFRNSETSLVCLKRIIT